MSDERYVVVSIKNERTGKRDTTFSRVSQQSGEIQLNKNYIHTLTPEEIEVNVLWCEERRKDHIIPEAEIDKKVFATCKSKGLEKDLLTAMIKQGKVCLTDHYKKRVELMLEMCGGGSDWLSSDYDV
jgi:hypothetical protein